MTKTVVESDKNAAFWVKGVNLSDESVMLFMFKNEKVGIMSKIVNSSGTLSLSPGKDGPSVFYITNYLSKRHLEELRIDLSDLRDIERRQLEDLHLSYIFLMLISFREARCTLNWREFSFKMS